MKSLHDVTLVIVWLTRLRDMSVCVVDKTSLRVVVNALCLEHDMHEKHIF